MAVSISLETEKKKLANLTYNFQKNINIPNIVPDEQKSYAGANLAGFYFEAMLYRNLKNLIEHVEPEAKEYTGSQKYAIKNFENPNASKDTIKEINKLKKGVQNAAMAAANVIYEHWKEEIENVSKEERKIENIATIDGGKGNPIGDLSLVIGKTTHTLELKWQNSPTRPVRWFSDTSDETLFNKGFISYLTQEPNKRIYWNHENEENYWKDSVTIDGLLGFLKERFNGDNNSMIRYFLTKGDATIDEHLDTKFVVHGSFTGINIIGLDLVADSLSGTNIIQRGQVVPGKTALEFKRNSESIAWFGIDKFRNERHSGKDSRYSEVGQANFTFAFYITQKAVNKFAK